MRALRLTKRERAARDALVDAATELVCHVDWSDARLLPFAAGKALEALILANEEWQEAQLRGREA